MCGDSNRVVCDYDVLSIGSRAIALALVSLFRRDRSEPAEPSRAPYRSRHSKVDCHRSLSIDCVNASLVLRNDSIVDVVTRIRSGLVSLTALHVLSTIIILTFGSKT